MTQNHPAAFVFRWSFAALFALGELATSAPAQTAQPNSIAGVYHGTYAGEQGPIKFKLELTQQGYGNLSGEFTLYVDDGSGANAYTCDVRGRYIPANRMVQVLRVRWKTPPPGGIDMPGMIGVFNPDGGNGAGQISGTMRGRPGPEFQAVRDADESAGMTSTVANQKEARAPTTPIAALRAAPEQSSPLPPPAPAVSGPAAINGVYTGEYRGTDGYVKLKFSIKATDDGSLTGAFTFELPRKPGSFITYKLTGKYVAGATEYGVGPSPFQFTSIEPVGSAAHDALEASKAQAVHVGLNGPGAIVGSLTGSIPGSGEYTCGRFNATKDRTASVDLDQVMAAQAGAGSSASAAAAPLVQSNSDGVYNGSYTSKQGGLTKFKLTLWTQHENRTTGGVLVNSNLAGALTFYLLEDSGTNAYTCELTGFYAPAHDAQPVRIQLTRTKWETPPPRALLFEAGMEGAFDPDGGNGAGQFSGYMSDASSSKFQSLRDAAESAKLASAQLSTKHPPSLAGVFNGTYARANEPPTKFKLTMTFPSGGGSTDLAGVATIYLPADSGTKAYTYSLKGAQDGYGAFHLFVNDWETNPPKDFQGFRAMGFSGKFVPDLAQNAARIFSAEAAGSLAGFYVPKFEATWDAAESADIPGTIAAQKGIGRAEQTAALQAHAKIMRNAPPKQLASKYLVRKSRQYWDGFQTDMIREVFDGGFGAAIDENEQFQKVFCTYVEMFSAKCPEGLPANHQTVTVIEKTNRKFDDYGNLISEDTRTYTVEMDPRFVDPYRRFHAALMSPGAGLRNAVAAMQSGNAQGVLHDLLALASDMQKFFADHGGKSAATRQLNENFLRAISGEPSLQQADGKIDGAQAESDPDLPPGRYARFVDGANAYFREREEHAPSYLGNSSSHDTALCQRLAELYEVHMSREEEYYYANDFAGRFLPIMGPRASCPDPAWPQLHPDVEQAVAEVK